MKEPQTPQGIISQRRNLRLNHDSGLGAFSLLSENLSYHCNIFTAQAPLEGTSLLKSIDGNEKQKKSVGTKICLEQSDLQTKNLQR